MQEQTSGGGRLNGAYQSKSLVIAEPVAWVVPHVPHIQAPFPYVAVYVIQVPVKLLRNGGGG